MGYDRRAKTEQLEMMREKVETETARMAQWAAHMDAAIAKAKVSLEALRTALAKVGDR